MKNKNVSFRDIENHLWEAADELRANSSLNSSEYFMPVMGLIFLRHAYNRYLAVKEKLEPTLPKRNGVPRPLTVDDFQSKNALYLREVSQFDYLLNLPNDKDKGKAIIDAMQAIEDDYPSLDGILPKDYARFDNVLLTNLLKIFNDDTIRRANGDLFGRIYEYFLMKFAIMQAQDEGEFFTPVSLVQTIVNTIEPDHGTVLDPACGSGGMFVQSSHFIEKEHKDPTHAVTFYGQEKSSQTIRLAKMNLAVHGLNGNILEGNTFYQDRHELAGKADFVMANPPFNVDNVDAQKVKGDIRLPFDLPGVNKKGTIGNANYLWIQYFYSYMNETGRAGFVMSSQASSSGGQDKEIRRKLVENGNVDIMMSIASGFFYTRTVPCELWFFNKQKPAEHKDKVLMLDLRNIKKLMEGSRRIYEFTPEQMKNISAIIWLYRGENERYNALLNEYDAEYVQEVKEIQGNRAVFEATVHNNYIKDSTTHDVKDLWDQYKKLAEELQNLILDEKWERCFEVIKNLQKSVSAVMKVLQQEFDKQNGDKRNIQGNRELRTLDDARQAYVDQLKQAQYIHEQNNWLTTRFPDRRLVDIEGLVKVVDKKEIEENDWSLTPGRYVGVAVDEDTDQNFSEVMQRISKEYIELDEKTNNLSKEVMSILKQFS